MAKSDTWEAGLLNLLFLNTAFTLVGDAAGLLPSAAPGSLYISLHTADPGETGTQATNEIAYTGYARVAVARSGAGWTVSGTAPTQVVNAANIVFGACTAGTPTASHFGIGTDAAGAGKLLYHAALTAPLAISPGITPQCLAGQLIVTEA